MCDVGRDCGVEDLARIFCGATLVEKLGSVFSNLRTYQREVVMLFGTDSEDIHPLQQR